MTHCPTCQMAGLDHDQVRARCIASPFWVGRYLLNYDKLSTQLHKTITDWFLDGIANGKRRFLIMIPRGHLKSSLFGMATMLWRVIVNQDERILYLTTNASKAEENLAAVKRAMYGDAFVHFFPDLVPDQKDPAVKWSQNVVRIRRRLNVADPTIKALGVDSELTGGHFTWRIFDDLIGEQNFESELEQERAIGRMRRATLLSVDRRTDVQIVIGTLWPGAFYEWLLKSGVAQIYEQVVLGCYVDERFHEFLERCGKRTTLQDGDPIWPDEKTNELLEEERIEVDSDFDWTHQMLNLWADESTKRFREEDLRYYRLDPDGTGVIVDLPGQKEPVTIPFTEMYRTITIDPATGEHQKTDESAITVCGQSRKYGLMFVLAVEHGRWLTDELVDRVMDLSAFWKPHVVGPEDVAYQKTLKHNIVQEQIRRGVHFVIKPVKPGNKSKSFRIIDRFQPFVRKHQVYFDPEQRALTSELLNLKIFKGKILGKSPNLADSLAYHVDFWQTPEVTEEDEDEIVFKIRNKEQDAVRPYGLECLT